ncbi:Hypothetical protein DEACI_1352 [Acididesulfobacillus acetoxydans]|uniref:Uncharacterized protein n=1 Tax=Acididesulfobacillus acetoxydans TaxID=1561005 RepID=A0A8S0W7F5_9FIRM|nr:Hypothetical protein DEACI_1352 [Acididesulfobacillus acetoxydans]CEJ09480.1 Hypothetical protein DEACI_3964 [Acididesulfobacillus acetoxydans]
MIGVEIDFVVSDCLKVLELYESILEVQRAWRSRPVRVG